MPRKAHVAKDGAGGRRALIVIEEGRAIWRHNGFRRTYRRTGDKEPPQHRGPTDPGEDAEDRGRLLVQPARPHRVLLQYRRHEPQPAASNAIIGEASVVSSSGRQVRPF